MIKHTVYGRATDTLVRVAIGSIDLTYELVAISLSAYSGCALPHARATAPLATQIKFDDWRTLLRLCRLMCGMAMPFRLGSS
jgi:hypothetical protein